VESDIYASVINFNIIQPRRIDISKTPVGSEILRISAVWKINDNIKRVEKVVKEGCEQFKKTDFGDRVGVSICINQTTLYLF